MESWEQTTSDSSIGSAAGWGGQSANLKGKYSASELTRLQLHIHNDYDSACTAYMYHIISSPEACKCIPNGVK